MKTDQHASEILIDIEKNARLKHKNLRFDDLLQFIGRRAFGMGLLFFALPNALPFSIIPGVAFIFSLPIIFFSFQMITGKNTLTLPKTLAKRSINTEKLIRVIHTTVPYLVKLERFLKPRWLVMTSRKMETINGIIIFGLALLLILPIPFSNFIFALLIVIFSLGLIEKDGICIIGAYLLTVFYLLFICTFILSALRTLF
ncbi:exopolysaccharide biosynthesis protein [Rickettsiella grylli]|nr:exopolysaccharide biosynthesis protein [Rickettsiella grylli]